MEKTTLYLDAALHRQLRDTARRENRPQAQLIREALAAYLETNSRPLPASLGMGSDGTLAGNEVRGWLRDHWHPQ
jgi:hypothetical protein